MTEDLHDLLAADRLFDITVDGAEGGLLCGEILLALSCHITTCLHHQRNHEDGYQGQPDVGVNHQCQRADYA